MTKEGPKHIAAPDYRIKPADINVEKRLWGALGCSALEEDARKVIGFCQTRGDWQPFTREEFLAFCYAKGYSKPSAHQDPATEMFAVSYLLGSRGQEQNGWIIKQGDKFCLTEEFIERCHAASPR